jgi:hypothetical protein
MPCRLQRLLPCLQHTRRRGSSLQPSLTAIKLRCNRYIFNIFGSYGSFAESQLIRAWDYCLAELDTLKASIDPRFKMVVSMSVGGEGDPTPELESYLNTKYTRGDVLFFAAAGNSGTPDVSYPAGYSAVISVAATTSDNSRASFSQYNADVEISAPGALTLSTIVLGDTGVSSATVSTMPPPIALGVEDDDLQKPPPTVIDGSGTGTVSAQGVDCGLGTSPCPNAAGKVCLIQRGEQPPLGRGPRLLLAPTSSPGPVRRLRAPPAAPGRLRLLTPCLAGRPRRRHLFLCQGPQLHGWRRRGHSAVWARRPAALRAAHGRHPHRRLRGAGQRVRGRARARAAATVVLAGWC